jgi:hypothetical protein
MPFFVHFARLSVFARFSGQVLVMWCPGEGENGGAGIGNKNKELFFCCPGWPGCPGEIQPFAHARARNDFDFTFYFFKKYLTTPGRENKINRLHLGLPLGRT